MAKLVWLLQQPTCCFLAGEHDDKYLLSDLEFEHELFVDRSFDLKLKDDYGNDCPSMSTILLH
jgi:hypothetical protein